MQAQFLEVQRDKNDYASTKERLVNKNQITVFYKATIPRLYRKMVKLAVDICNVSHHRPPKKDTTSSSQECHNISVKQYEMEVLNSPSSGGSALPTPTYMLVAVLSVIALTMLLSV